MQNRLLDPDPQLAPYVKSILVFESREEDSQTHLPFYADGFPGLIFHTAGSRLRVYPHPQKMPEVFIYGQTLQPVEIRIKGRFQLVIFQLYPFALRTIFDLDPHSITDNCHKIPHFLKTKQSGHTKQKTGSDSLIQVLSQQLLLLMQEKVRAFDPLIKQAIEKILDSKGQLSLKQLALDLAISSRSLERRFFQQTALKPKQFSRIIQFQNSLIQLSVRDYNKLTDVVYDNGYADQSHFIRVFRSFTGKIPSRFLKNTRQ